MATYKYFVQFFFSTLRLAPITSHRILPIPPCIQISFRIFPSIFKPLFPRLQLLDHFSTFFEVRLAHLPLPRTLLVPRPPLFRAATRPFVERSIPRPRGHRSVPTLTRYVTITGSRIDFQPRFSPSSVIVIFGESGTAYISLQGRITNLLPLPLPLSKSVAQSCLRISTGLNRLQIGRDELDSIQRRFLSRDDGWETRISEIFSKIFSRNLNEWNLRILVELKVLWRTCHFWNLEKFNWNDDSSDFRFFKNLFQKFERISRRILPNHNKISASISRIRFDNGEKKTKKKLLLNNTRTNILPRPGPPQCRILTRKIFEAKKLLPEPKWSVVTGTPCFARKSFRDGFDYPRVLHFAVLVCHVKVPARIASPRPASSLPPPLTVSNRRNEATGRGKIGLALESWPPPT